MLPLDYSGGRRSIGSSVNIQDGREMSAIIVTGNYLCYNFLKVLLTFFLILIFNELFKFKTLDEWQH